MCVHCRNPKGLGFAGCCQPEEKPVSRDEYYGGQNTSTSGDEVVERFFFILFFSIGLAGELGLLGWW